MRVDSKIIGVEKEGNSIAVNIELTGGISQITGTHMLVATGRRPNTDDLGLDNSGIATDRRRIYPGGRPVAHQHLWHLGDGRLQWPRRVHAHVVE